MSMTWREINKQLSSLTEQQLKELLEAEVAGPRRASILQRVHQRYSVLRTARERVELLHQAAQP